MPANGDRFAMLTGVWLALVLLTLLGLGLSAWARDYAGLPLIVALLVWVKGVLVARGFIEWHAAHPFVAAVLKVFVAIAPVALLVSALWGAHIARWATL